MVNFYLKDKTQDKTSVTAQVYINGNRYRISTGISVRSAYWNAGKQRLKVRANYPEAEAINIKLTELEEAINANALKYKLSGDDITPQMLMTNNHVTTEVIAYGNNFLQHCGFAEQTKKKYITCINKLGLYQEQTGKVIHFSDIDIAFYRSFKRWFYNQVNEKTELPYSKNYWGSIIKTLKSLVHRATEDGLTDGNGLRHSQFTTDIELTSAVYLTTKELERIYNIKFNRSLIEQFTPDIRESDLKRKISSLETVRARFLLGAYTGLRVSDFLKYDIRNVTDGQIRLKTKKTGQQIVVPLHPFLLALIESGSLDKSVSEQKVNLHIKEICRMAKITDQVTTYRKHADKQIATTSEKCNMVTTHTARRSFATNAYIAGIPAIGIMRITGHRTEVSFLRYIRISEEENATSLKNHPFFTGG